MEYTMQELVFFERDGDKLIVFKREWLNRSMAAITGWFVYGLMDPRTMKFRYVGATGNIERRNAQHCDYTLSKRGGLVRKWKMELNALGMVPLFVALKQYMCETDMYKAEKGWADKLKLEGHPVLNNPKKPKRRRRKWRRH